MSLEYTFRPLPLWPYPSTVERRSRYTFKASWSNTLALLERELRHVDGRRLVIGAGFREAETFNTESNLRPIRVDALGGATDARGLLMPVRISS